MAKRENLQIADLLRPPSRFLRSVQLDRDFRDPTAPSGYVVTPFVRAAFDRIADGLRLDSGRRAWRLTGDYGVGKSAFALALARIFCAEKPTAAVGRLRRDFGVVRKNGALVLLPILVTGAREGIIGAIARGVRDAFTSVQTSKRPPRSIQILLKQADATATNGTARDLEELLVAVHTHTAARGAGVFLVLDELGKLLEHAAQEPTREDVFILQRIAEFAARSGKHPFLVLGLLHQGFHAYAERLPSTQRHEWEKVAGRFDEIVFDQPLAHTAALVAAALGVDTDRLPRGVRTAAGAESVRAAQTTGWFADGKWLTADQALHLYPLHATLLPVLIRFFRRFGQHERSLFSFLLSSEPFGVQAFADRQSSPDALYRINDFYDYVRTTFGHRLSGSSYRNSWVRILATMDAAIAVDAVEARVLKITALLNLVDADDLLPSDTVLRAAAGDAREVEAAIDRLVARGMMFRRGAAAGYRLWPTGSVNLEAAFAAAARANGTPDDIARHLVRFVDQTPVLARRHYLETGTLRYFDVRVVTAREPLLKDPQSGGADGTIVIVLADSESERTEAYSWATAITTEDLTLLVAIPPPVTVLREALHDVRCWRWILDNYAELSDDVFAAEEASRQLAAASLLLRERFDALLGLDATSDRGVTWIRSGRPAPKPPRGGVAAVVSAMCDDLYSQAPRITNELLNRNALSSAAAAARMRLIEGMFLASDQREIGLDPDKAPPERSMYLSVLQRGRVHREEHGRYFLDEPREGEDPLRLRPVLAHVVKLLEDAHGGRVPVTTLLNEVRGRPFGVRDGVAPLLLAVVLGARAHEIAVYERGTFLHRFGPSDFLRLLKQPASFECQLCRVVGVRAEVFRRLVDIFAEDRDRKTQTDLLDVVTPLCKFAAQLPDYTRRTSRVDATAARVRMALLGGREPGTLLFNDLPLACDMAPFAPDDMLDESRIDSFVVRLQASTMILRDVYPQLLTRIVADVAGASGDAGGPLDRARLAARAARVSLVAREVRLRAFALRLRDPGLTEDAWAEALGSFVVGKPPTRWLDADLDHWQVEIEKLFGTFVHVEAAAFRHGPEPLASAVRLAVTRADGREVDRVIDTRPDIEAHLIDLVADLARVLPRDKGLRLAALSRLLWDELGGGIDTSPSDAADLPDASSETRAR